MISVFFGSNRRSILLVPEYNRLSGEDEQESGESAQHEAKQLDHAEFVAGDIVDEFMNLKVMVMLFANINDSWRNELTEKRRKVYASKRFFLLENELEELENTRELSFE